MKGEKYFTILLVMCVVSYFMMLNLSMTAVAEDLSNYEYEDVNRYAFINDMRNSLMYDMRLTNYVQSLTGLEYDECNFFIRECKYKNIDPFIVLGIIKRESNFDPYAVGVAGERGLGQLMENTARPVAENLGYVYDPDKLYDPRYNLKLTITQITYLLKLYDNDVHKALTAYNRGQQGLTKYIEDNNSAVSDYSLGVLKYAEKYKESFRKIMELNT
jgi:soluble lytic murein transglycosylase-like protein